MRKKTALIAAIGALIIFGTIAAALFSSGGDTKSVQRIAAPTSLYGVADISSAFDAIEATFASDFTGCTLKELRYNGEIERTYLDDELDCKQTGAEDRIIVLSTFTTKFGDPQTKASRQMRRTKTGSGYSPGLRKTPRGAWKAGGYC